MEYYQAIEDPKGTLLMRYFVTEDQEVRAKTLPEVQHAMENLVSATIDLTSGHRIRWLTNF